jgi:hypothetical protein
MRFNWFSEKYQNPFGSQNMKSQLLAIVAVITTLNACTVHDRKLPEEGGETGSQQPVSAEAEKAQAPAALPKPTASISLDNAQVYGSEPVKLSWASENSESCTLKANGSEIVRAGPVGGADTFYPTANTDYEITCQASTGETVSALASVIVLGDDDVFLNLTDSINAAQYIDMKALGEGNCTEAECIFADLEPFLFLKPDAGSGMSATDEFLQKSSQEVMLLPGNQAINVKSLTSAFDLATSTVYGAEDRLAELGLSEKCQANFSIAKGASLLNAYTFSTSIEDGFENLPDTKLTKFNVLSDLRLSAKGRRGVVKAGSDITATYKPVDIMGSVKASFTDFETLKGGFGLPKNVLSSNGTLQKVWASVKAFFAETVAYAVTFPTGYPVPYPANGYQYNPNSLTCSLNGPVIRTSTTYQNRTQYCQATGDLCCELASACPQKWPFTVTQTSIGHPMSYYVPRVRSLRVVAGPGTVQCGSLFPGLVEYYGISSSWVANSPNAQFFVSDAAWPACGGYSCADKIMRSSWDVSSSVEPSYNHCIDRWLGLDFNSYLGVLQTDCQNTDVFRAAVAVKAAKDADQAFASACNGNTACKDAITSVASIRNEFPLESLRRKLETEEAALLAAKSENKTYLVKDVLFFKASTQKLVNYVSKISSGLDSAEALRKATSPQADWIGGGTLIHKQGTILGFTNYSESKSTLDEYVKLKDRVMALTAPKAVDVGCSFSASGRFRRYSAANLQSISVKPSDKAGSIIQLKLLQDYIAK